MRLGDLLAGLGEAVEMEGEDVEVAGVAVDSRAVRPGDVFFALAERAADRARHASEAVARGARAIVAAADVDAAGARVIRTAAARRLAGHAAARLAGEPSAAMTVVGVTGTNGKTTTTYLLEAIWRAAGVVPGVLGTIAYRLDGTARPAPLTTPDGPTLQALLAEARAAGVTHVAMEVSSHALTQDRVAGCRFDAAIFTNLTRDHLDFHGDLERYYAAKARLFLEHLPASGKPAPVAVVNVQDPAGARLADVLDVRCVRVARTAPADVTPDDVETTLAGTHGGLRFGAERVAFTCAL